MCYLMPSCWRHICPKYCRWWIRRYAHFVHPYLYLLHIIRLLWSGENLEAGGVSHHGEGRGTPGRPPHGEVHPLGDGVCWGAASEGSDDIHLRRGSCSAQWQR